MTDDPDFYAWLDGELPEPAASAMATRVASDPELAALAEEHRALHGRLRSAFGTLLDAPVPAGLQAALDHPPAADILPFAARSQAPRRRVALTGLAHAASLALGLLVGGTLPRASEGLYRASGSGLAASGSLDRALDTQLARAGSVDGIRLGLSFRDGDGQYCRSFDAGSSSGLACRDGDSWRVEGLVGGAPTGSDYRMASGLDPALGELIDRRMAGDPLDAEAEARLARSGWQD